MPTLERSTEASPKIPVHALPGIHDTVKKLLANEPRGKLLDIPAGSGAFAQWSFENGFETYAGDLEDQNFLAQGVVFRHTNLDEAIPFGSDFFDYVVCIEGIEHLQNQFLLIREISRVLKTGGELILTTPSLMNLDSRLHFFWTGFQDSLPLPLNPNTPGSSRDHINLVTFPALDFNLRLNGFEIEQLATNRIRRGSLLMFPFLYPWIWLMTRKSLAKENDPTQRERNRRLFKFMLSREMLLGRIHVIKAVKTSAPN